MLVYIYALFTQHYCGTRGSGLVREPTTHTTQDRTFPGSIPGRCEFTLAVFFLKKHETNPFLSVTAVTVSHGLSVSDRDCDSRWLSLLHLPLCTYRCLKRIRDDEHHVLDRRVHSRDVHVQVLVLGMRSEGLLLVKLCLSFCHNCCCGLAFFRSCFAFVHF